MKNVKIPSLVMQNKEKIPILGFGTYFLRLEDVYSSVLCALESGYRMLDTAKWYNNEEIVGRAIIDSKIPREELFITSKIEDVGYDQTINGVLDTLNKFNTDYLDLVLIHWPTNNVFDTYKALEDLVDKGIIKSIGISNFHEKLCDELLKVCRIKPQINQIETHIYFQEVKMNKYLKSKKIIHESWAPFAEGYMNMLYDDVLLDIGKKYNKSAAQVILRFFIQKDIVVIPKSTNKDHIKENLEVFDFELDNQDIKRIELLDRKQQYSSFPINMKEETNY
jgi:diketogulonate reductase-like aldo/keto reductase